MPGPPRPPIQRILNGNPGQRPVEQPQGSGRPVVVNVTVKVSRDLVSGLPERLAVRADQLDHLFLGRSLVTVRAESGSALDDGIGGDGRHRVRFWSGWGKWLAGRMLAIRTTPGHSEVRHQER